MDSDDYYLSEIRDSDPMSHDEDTESLHSDSDSEQIIDFRKDLTIE